MEEKPPSDGAPIEELPRLIEAAGRATAHLPAGRRVNSPGTLADAMGVSPQAVTNWAKRGVPHQQCIRAQALWGISPQWVKTGHVESAFSRDPQTLMPTAVMAVGDLEAPRYKVAPPTVDWPMLVQQPLPLEFETTAPDAAMSPDLPAGTRAIFSTSLAPRPGDWVLVQVDSGAAFVREYRVAVPGAWLAHAINPAYPSFDSRQHQLQVLAVFDGMRGRRARD